MSLSLRPLLHLGLTACFLVLGACKSSPPVAECHNILRAVVDMGSGSTKMTLAEVAKCPAPSGQKAPAPRLVRVLDDKTGEALALEAGKDNAGNIPPELQQKAIALLGRMRDTAKAQARELGHSELEIAFTGTHAYRTAKNLSEFGATLAVAGFNVKALSQDEEALAGVSAVQRLPVANACSPLLVWDVGGGSAQFSFDQGADSVSVGLQVGAESFKKLLINSAQKRPKTACVSKSPSPNPLGTANFTQNLALARRFADRQIDKLPYQVSCAVGIGGVHRKAVGEQIEKRWESIKSCACAGQKPEEACAALPGQYSRKELACLTQFLSAKSDCDEEIKGPYSDTAVSNLYMVLAFMDKFGLERIHTASVNMGHALVTDDLRLNFVKVSAAP